MRQTICLAQEMGKGLGTCAVLQRPVQKTEKQQQTASR